MVHIHFELVQWKHYTPATYGTLPRIQNLYDNDSNNLISTTSYRDLDYLKNWHVFFRKVITVLSDHYMFQLRVKSQQFRAVMLRGGLDIQFTGVGANTLKEPAVFVIIQASYGDIASATLT